MKLIVLLTVVFTFQVSANADAQDISIAFENARLEKVMAEIKRQSGYNFFFNAKLLEEAPLITVAVRNGSLEETLREVLKDQPFRYEIKGRNIILTPLENTERVNPVLIRQQTDVSGTVSDTSGGALPGVTVMLKGTARGTSTDADGSYTLSQVPEDGVLVFSFLGYHSVEVPVNGGQRIDVALTEDIAGLEETVVVGYGTQKKVNLTGAVSTVSGEELVNRPAVGTVAALQGVIPGATITRQSGSPGEEDFNIQIRGLTSVNNNPVLVLVDGIEGNINDVRPEDIESISVLKDAAAASIYGAKAAGGVILVTTKKGQPGKISVEYSSYVTASKLGRLPERLHSYEWAEMRNLAMVNAGSSPVLTEEEIGFLRDPDFLYDVDPANPNRYRYWGDYDYAELTLKEFTVQQSHHVAVSGGTENTTYRLSGTYFKNGGILKIGPDNNERYTGRFSLGSRIGKYLKLSSIASYSRNTVEKPAGAPSGDTRFEGQHQFFSNVFTTPGVAPLRDPNGHWAFGTRIGGFDGRSKIADVSWDAGRKTLDQNNLRLNTSLLIDNIVKGLELRLVGAIDANFDNSLDERHPIPEYGLDGTAMESLIYNQNAVVKSNSTSVFKEFQFLADYGLEVGDHAFHVLGGYSSQDYRLKSFNARANDLVNRDVPDFNWASNVGIQLGDEVATNAFQSVFGRLNYAFRDKYLLEADLRYDGSSKLNPNDRYKLFPAASAGWRLSEEPWFDIPAVTEFKIRGSWGRLGNAGVLGNYDYIPLLNVGDDLILTSAEARSQYVFQQVLASRSLTWETVESSNIGFDLTMLNGKFSLTADYFSKRNIDMLARVAYPSVIGIGVPNLNAGELKTWGWEAEASWRNSTGKDFSYWVRANVSDAQNELVEYLGADVIGEGTRRLLNGYPVNSIWGYRTDGYFQTDEEVDAHAFRDSRTGAGDVKYVDLDGDGEINPGGQRVDDPGDLVLLGDSNPRYSFGLQAGFNWKGFDLMVFFQGVGKRVFLMDQFSMMPFFREWLGPQRQHLDYWTPENPDAFWPRPYSRGDHNFRPSDKWTQDAAYIRLKDLQIGYTLPQNVVSRIGAQKLRIYFAGRDLWETTKTFDYIDPETPDGATFVYPFRRKLTLGLNLLF